jgi:hypothetical protein
MKLGDTVWIVVDSHVNGRDCSRRLSLETRRVLAWDGLTVATVRTEYMGDRMEFWPAADVHANKAEAALVLAWLADRLRGEGCEVEVAN